jgi:hypothetical protein
MGLQGQQWITLEQLQRTHRNTLYQEREGISGGTTTPLSELANGRCSCELKRETFCGIASA